MYDMTNNDEKLNFENVLKTLENKGSSFVIATVIRTMSSTAAKPGMKAIISNKGEILSGWLGGGCVTNAVRNTALETLNLKKPKLVVLSPDDIKEDLDELKSDQTFHKKNYCPSEGSMDIFVEPFYPKSELIIYGNTPIANELAKFGEKYSFNVVHVRNFQDDNNNNLNEFSEKFIVIATQGNSDLIAITESLKVKATYIGLVASQKKYQALKKKIIDDGVSQEKLKDIICPAGIFINAIMPEEVALSIFAEIIELKRSGKIGSKKF